MLTKSNKTSRLLFLIPLSAIALTVVYLISIHSVVGNCVAYQASQSFFGTSLG